MKNKFITLPIIYLALLGSAMGYYFGSVSQGSRAIAVKVNKQGPTVSSAPQAGNGLAVKSPAALSIPAKVQPAAVQSAVTPKTTAIKTAVKPKVAVPVTAVATSPAPIKPVPTAQVTAPAPAVASTPAPTPTTKVS